MRLSTVSLLVVFGFLFLLPSPSEAQGRGGRRGSQRYSSPYGSTLSPYLDYFRVDTGFLDPYNAFVRPRQQLNSDLNNLRQQTRQSFTQIEDDLLTFGLSNAAPTGIGATYLNTSHYYSSNPTLGGSGGGPAFRPGGSNLRPGRASTLARQRRPRSNSARAGSNPQGIQ